MTGPTELRCEQPGDYAGIAEVNALAFGRDNEAHLVELLRRQPDYDPGLSLVAVDAAQVVGHILFSSVQIERPDGSGISALALAPMAVRPERQNQRIGSALVLSGLDACRQRGHGLVIVVGHPRYYPRFGFEPARQHGLEVPFAVPDEAFMVCRLSPRDNGLGGMVRYPPAFAEV